ncbi:hypothetical protein K8R03_03635 [Candidatus Kaiserbacteria bacterium]|nr:hypothetical protein [Candidatus Kaiserbacteria bacterium]
MGLISQHKFAVIGVIIVVAGGIWYGLTQNSAPEALVTQVSTSSGSPTQDSADQELVATLLTLRAVTLSGTIFQDPAFTALRDFGTTIVSEPVGRQNPFAPLGASGSRTSTSSQSAAPGASSGQTSVPKTNR